MAEEDEDESPHMDTDETDDVTTRLVVAGLINEMNRIDR
jgi:hypothetical protein